MLIQQYLLKDQQQEYSDDLTNGIAEKNQPNGYIKNTATWTQFDSS